MSTAHPAGMVLMAPILVYCQNSQVVEEQSQRLLTAGHLHYALFSYRYLPELLPPVCCCFDSVPKTVHHSISSSNPSAQC